MIVLNLPTDSVRSLITDTDKTLEAIITQDYNGSNVVTIFYTGHAIAVAEVPSPDDSGQWEWHGLEDSTGTFNQVRIDLLFEIGELSEEDHDAYVEAIGTDREYHAYHDALESSGEGHEWIRLVTIVEEAYDARQD